MLSFQTELCPELPPVYADKNFHVLCALLARMDELIVQSGLEEKFVASFPITRRSTAKQRRRLVKALRCTLLRLQFRLPYARAARELASNYLYQKFCGLIQVDRIKVPSAKTLERYEKMASSETLQTLVAHLNLVAALPVNVSARTRWDWKALSIWAWSTSTRRRSRRGFIIPSIGYSCATRCAR
jgi:hypothetical protein